MDIDNAWVEFAKAVGPTAVIAVFAIWGNQRLIMRLMDKFDQLEENNLKVAGVLGEVMEALRRFNGKS